MKTFRSCLMTIFSVYSNEVILVLTSMVMVQMETADQQIQNHKHHRNVDGFEFDIHTASLDFAIRSSEFTMCCTVQDKA